MRTLSLRAKIGAVSLSTVLATTTFFSAPLFPLANADPVHVDAVQLPSFASVVDKVKPAVVSVQVKSNIQQDETDFTTLFGGPGFDQLPDDHPLKRFFKEFEDRDYGRKKSQKPGRPRPIALGSGFFISEDGYIVTNNHVVADGTSYSVVLDDGTELDAKLVGTDPRTDLAVLKVNAKRKFTYVAFADDTKVKIGDWVVAVGNPFGLGGSVTAGIVSARGRDIGANAYDDFIQIDAAVNKGNSGGPTFDLTGQVVGINTAIFSPSGGSVGIAFDIPASTAKHVVNELIEKGSVQRGWIGVQIQPVTKEIADSLGLKDAKGAIVADAMDGPAAKAGVKSGDAIIAVNGENINDARDLARRIANLTPNQTATLTVWRDGKKQDIKVTLSAMPKDKTDKTGNAEADTSGAQALDQFGLTVTPSEDGPGVVVTNVDPDGDAADQGLRPGDVIISVNNKTIKKASDITAAVAEAKKAGKIAVLLQVQSNNQNRFLALLIGSK